MPPASPGCAARKRFGDLAVVTETAPRSCVRWRSSGDALMLWTEAITAANTVLSSITRWSALLERSTTCRSALARWLTVPRDPDELGLHECDMPLCVKVCDPGAVRQHR